MKISMNGFRKNLSSEVDKLKRLVIDAANMQLHDKDELYNSMNQVICYVNTLNCIYDDKDPDFKDMSDLEIKQIEIDE